MNAPLRLVCADCGKDRTAASAGVPCPSCGSVGVRPETLLGVVAPTDEPNGAPVTGHMRFVGSVTYCPVVKTRVAILGETECSGCGGTVRPWTPAP